ncbi:MAG TPA: PocR ligand-binding domain-containing protein, partial [bacterium]|nr:PocR ligand-binding domain-containing protein [bacterium]
MNSIPKRLVVAFLLAMFATVIGGRWVADWREKVVDGAMRGDLLTQAEAIARVINPEWVKSLSFSEADKTNPVYRRLCSQMKAYAEAIGFRSLYSMALRDGNIVFGPESLDEGDPWASPPGTVYKEPSELDFQIFETGIPSVQGPVTDEYGTFVSAQAPVLDPDTNEVLLVIGIDVEAGEWQRAIDNARRTPILFTLALGLTLLGGIATLFLRDRFPARHRLHYTEACLTAALGILLTGIAAWALHQDQVSSRREVFKPLAFAEMVNVRGALDEIRACMTQISGFFEADEHVDRRAFHSYTRLLVRNRNLQALMWIPVVPAHSRENWEREIREEGFPEFVIYEKGDNGEFLPAPGRDFYYPVLYVEPMQGNERVLGCDFRSDPRYRTAMEEAAGTGLPVIIESTESFQATGGLKTLFLFYPIYSQSSKVSGEASSDTASSSLRGFVLGVICPQDMLTRVLNPFDREDVHTIVDLLEAQPGIPPRFLASSLRKHAEIHRVPGEIPQPKYTDFSMIYPLLVFNDTYLLVVYPTPTFFEANPARAGWVAGLMGMFITVVLTVFGLFLSNRRAELERQVSVRTAELQEAQQRFHTILDVTGTRIIIIDSEHNLQYVDPGWQRDRGDPTGRKCYEYFMGQDKPCEDCLAARALETGQVLVEEGPLTPENKRIFEVHRIPFQDQNGRRLVAEFSVDIDRRKRAEEALRDSQRQLLDIFNFLPDATFVIDTNRTVVAWNRAIEEMTGVKAKDILGKGDYEYALPFYGIRRPILIDLILEPNEDIKKRYHFVRREGDILLAQADVQIRGETLALWIIAKPLYNSHGDVVGAIECIRDITESEQARIALHKSEARVRRKLAAILDPEGDIGTLELSDILDVEALQAVMEEFYRVTRFSTAIIDVQGRVLVSSGWQDICTKYHRIHPETLRNCIESDTALTKGVPEGTYKLYQCKNGLWDVSTPIVVGGNHVGNLFLGQFLFEGEALDIELFRSKARQYGFDEKEYLAALDRVPRWNRETVDAVMAFYTKFTVMISRLSYGNVKLARTLAERDQLLNALLEGETMLSDAQEMAGMGSFVWDLQTDRVEYSRNALALAGASQGAFASRMDRIVRGLVHPDDQARVNEEIRKMLEERETWPIEFRIVRPDGQERIWQARLRFITDESGKPIKCVGLQLDITERKEAEKETEKLQAQLFQAQKMESVGRLAGGVAHDFNNMLQAIFGYTDMALDQVNPEHPLYSSLRGIQKAAQRSANLTRQLLAFARKQTVNPRILDLNDAVTGMLKMLRRLIGENIELTWLPADTPCNVKIDPSQIDQILANLTVNARDAIRGVGRITIETSQFVFDEAYCATHEGTKPGKYILLTVSDTGCGMDKET